MNYRTFFYGILLATGFNNRKHDVHLLNHLLANSSMIKSLKTTFYNEHTAELILFESAKKYLKEHLGESKTLNISKWKSEIGTLRKEKDNLYSQIVDVRKEVEQAEKVKICIEQLQEQEKKLSQVKRNELDL